MAHFSLSIFAFKNLRRKPLRTAILSLSIALLVAVTVFSISFVTRINASINKATERLGADILIVPAGSRGAAEDVLLESKSKSFFMDKSLIDKVKEIKGIDVLTYQTYLVTLTGKCCDVPDAVIVAFDQDTDFIIAPWLKEKLKRKLKKGEAVVGSESAFNIDVGLMEVDSVLFGNVFKMVGVLDKTGTGLDTAIFVSDENMPDIIKSGQSEIKPNQISLMFAKVKSGYDSSKVAGKIEDSIIEVDTIARKDIGKAMIDALKDINRIFLITITLACILSTFLAWSVFSAIANERAKEVGIMRALGAKESHITKLFLTEVVIIGAIGSLAGVAGGTALSIVLAKGFTILKNLSVDLNIIQRSIISVVGLCAGTGICVSGALFPLRRLKKMEPLSVIKED
ncbi:MAG: ABC transporter permease [Nitrospirae bacterium]|nr:ABC transporter permease [Nitrospirota bacterium]